MNAVKLVRKRLHLSRESLYQKIAERNQEPQEANGTYVGFNAESGSALVQLAGGGVVATQLITNGNLEVGGSISLSLPNDGVAVSDAMPF